MTRKSRNNLIAYGVLVGICLAVAVIARVRPDVFADGPPAFGLFLSFRGTAVVALLGLIGVVFLNLGSLRGLWDSDLSVRQKVLIPVVVGMALGVVTVLVRQFTPVDEVVAAFLREMGVERFHPSTLGAALGYLSGGILLNIVYFLILIPPVVYLVSDRLLKGKKQGVVYWSIATPLAFWEPLTNPPVELTIDAFGPMGAIGFVILGAVFTMMQVWFMRRYGFVALVCVRAGHYAISHLLIPLHS